jgi:hypothetical protein
VLAHHVSAAHGGKTDGARHPRTGCRIVKSGIARRKAGFLRPACTHCASVHALPDGASFLR